MNSDRLISFRTVSVDFEQRHALNEVSVVLDQKRIAVIGSNGSGKSTFARLLNGLASASRGEVRVHGLDPVRQARLLRRRVGFIFSNPDSQIVMPTVADDIAFSLRGRGLSRTEVDRRVSLMIENHGLTGFDDSPAHSLSGGQKQLLALSSVLVSEPELIVADEPTALLDAANTRRISNHLLDEMPQQLVLVTHDLRLAERCDVTLWFDHGRLIRCGDSRAVIAEYERSHA
jgi:biotin transport system ATP-binding protein